VANRWSSRATSSEPLARNPRPTAIFAGADLTAFGAPAALHEAELAVPGDISVVGYDNTRMASAPGADRGPYGVGALLRQPGARSPPFGRPGGRRMTCGT
jgi:ABC-type sugar transport system substrate-binding protein